MPGPVPTHVIGDTTLPERVDVVVIGGGIIGVSTTLELAERGISVALCEKGEIAAEQSSRNWGWVRMGLRSVVAGIVLGLILGWFVLFRML